MFEPTFKKVTWKDVEAEVKAVNPRLHKIICDINPGPKYRLYVGEYPYGCEILRRGKYHVPIKDHGMVPLNHPDVPTQIKEDLSYNIETNPVTLVLKNSIEVFMDKPTSPNPITFFVSKEGTLLSISRVLNKQPHQPAFLWNATSGARSIFMLPKISQAKRYKRLRTELNIDIDTPSDIESHWDIFKKIGATCESNPWTSKTLCFSKNWFQELDDPKWHEFKLIIYEYYGNSFGRMGNSFIWDVVFNLILNENDIRASLYINNVVKYLFQVGTGLLTSLSPLTTEKEAPIKYLQKIFLEVYGLQDYIPSIMGPTYFDFLNTKNIVYYSLQNPNLFDTPKKKHNNSFISEIYDIKSLFNKYHNSIITKDLNLEDTQLYNFAKKCSVGAYHPNPEKYSIVDNVINLVNSDANLKKTLYPCKNKEIALHSPLFKGCFKFSISE